MNPRASAPITTSMCLPVPYSTRRSTASRRATGSCSSGMMSRKRMPSLGKSGMSRTCARRSIRPSVMRFSLRIRSARAGAAGEASHAAREEQLAELRGRLDDVVELLEAFAAALLPVGLERRQQHLLDEADLAVDGALDHAQVLGPQTELRQLRRGSHDAGVGLGVAAHPADLPGVHELELLELGEQRGVGAGHLLDLFGRVLAFLPHRQQIGLAQPLTRRGQRARRAAFDLPADDLEGQVLVALHAEHAHQAPEVVLRVQAVAGLGAARRDQALLLQIPQLADADVGELAAQALDDGADREQLLAADVEEELGGVVHDGMMNVSLYLPIWISSPSASATRSPTATRSRSASTS